MLMPSRLRVLASARFLEARNTIAAPSVIWPQSCLRMRPSIVGLALVVRA